MKILAKLSYSLSPRTCLGLDDNQDVIASFEAWYSNGAVSKLTKVTPAVVLLCKQCIIHELMFPVKLEISESGRVYDLTTGGIQAIKGHFIT